MELRHAETELFIEYSHSPIIFGDPNPQLAPGFRLPDTIDVRDASGHKAKLHTHGHRADHSLILLGGPAASHESLAKLHADLSQALAAHPIFESVAAFSTSTTPPSSNVSNIGHISADAAALLGIDGITLFVLRPDAYIGLRADRDHLAALDRYARVVKSGHSQSRAHSQNFAPSAPHAL